MSLTFNSLCKEIIENGILEFGNFTLSDGNKSEYYFNSKKIYSNKKIFDYVVDTIVEKIKSNYFDNYKFICGVPFGSLPLSTALSLKLNKPILFIRKQKKTYGNKSFIEGDFNIGDTVLLIEDIISTGNNIINTKNILINSGLIPVGFTVLLNKEIGGFEYIINKDFKGLYVYKLSSIILNLVNNNIIDSFDNNKYEESTMIQQTRFKIKNNIIKENKNYLKKRDFKFNYIQKIIFSLIEHKKTNLCLDLTHIHSWDKCKKIIEICGKFIILLKIDIEVLEDFDNIKLFCIEIKSLMKKYNFLTINFCNYDFKDINKLFHSYLIYNEWANFITLNTKQEKEIFNKLNKIDDVDLSYSCLENYTPSKLNYEKLEFYDLEEYDNNSPLILSNTKITKNRINIYNLDCKEVLHIEEIITKKKYHIVSVSNSVTELYNENNNIEILKRLNSFANNSNLYYKKTFKINIEFYPIKEFYNLFITTEIDKEGLYKEELYGKIRIDLNEQQNQLNKKNYELKNKEIELNTQQETFNKNKIYIYITLWLLLQSYCIYNFKKILF